MKIKLEPFGERLLAKRMSPDETPGGILFPETKKMVSLLAKVLHVGPDCTWVKVDDTIFFGRYAPFILPLEDIEGIEDRSEVLIMNEADVLCKIVKEKDDAR